MAVVATDRAYAQRLEGLERANESRARRAAFKRALYDGSARIEDAIREPEWFLCSVRVCDLLEMAPRVGADRVSRVLRRAQVWPLRLAGRLTVAQRERIVMELDRTRADCRPSAGRLPAGPFREWLTGFLVREQCSAGELAERAGVDSSTLRKVQGGRTSTVLLATVDRVLTVSGVHLSELYPHERSLVQWPT